MQSVLDCYIRFLDIVVSSKQCENPVKLWWTQAVAKNAITEAVCFVSESTQTLIDMLLCRITPFLNM